MECVEIYCEEKVSQLRIDICSAIIDAFFIRNLEIGLCQNDYSEKSILGRYTQLKQIV